MTNAPFERRRPRTTTEYRWHLVKAQAFIDALLEHGKVATAARGVGMTRQSAYRLRRRVPQVAAVWDQAQAIGRARRRGELPEVSPYPDEDRAVAGQGDTFGDAS